MPTIWTPSGEHVPRPEPEPGQPPPPPPPGGPPGREPTPEEIEAALAEVRAILARPVVDHVAGHAMGLFELALLHLQPPAGTMATGEPDLAEASLAIDAMAALVEGLGDRLGAYRQSLEEALAQLRLAFVRISEDKG